VSRTSITLKFKNALVSKGSTLLNCKLYSDGNIPPLMPDEAKNFGGSLVLDFRK